MRSFLIVCLALSAAALPTRHLDEDTAAAASSSGDASSPKDAGSSVEGASGDASLPKDAGSSVEGSDDSSASASDDSEANAVPAMKQNVCERLANCDTPAAPRGLLGEGLSPEGCITSAKCIDSSFKDHQDLAISTIGCVPHEDGLAGDGCHMCARYLKNAAGKDLLRDTVNVDCNSEEFDLVVPTTSCYWGGLTSSEEAHIFMTGGSVFDPGQGPDINGYAYGALVVNHMTGNQGCAVNRAVLGTEAFYPKFKSNLPAQYGVHPMDGTQIMMNQAFSATSPAVMFVNLPMGTYNGCGPWDGESGTGWPEDVSAEALAADPDMQAAVDACFITTSMPSGATGFSPTLAKSIDLSLHKTPMVHITDIDATADAWKNKVQAIADATVALGQNSPAGCRSNGFHVIQSDTPCPCGIRAGQEACTMADTCYDCDELDPAMTAAVSASIRMAAAAPVISPFTKTALATSGGVPLP